MSAILFKGFSQGISYDVSEMFIADRLVAVWAKAAVGDCYVTCTESQHTNIPL